MQDADPTKPWTRYVLTNDAMLDEEADARDNQYNQPGIIDDAAFNFSALGHNQRATARAQAKSKAAETAHEVRS